MEYKFRTSDKRFFRVLEFSSFITNPREIANKLYDKTSDQEIIAFKTWGPKKDQFYYEVYTKKKCDFTNIIFNIVNEPLDIINQYCKDNRLTLKEIQALHDYLFRDGDPETKFYLLNKTLIFFNSKKSFNANFCLTLPFFYGLDLGKYKFSYLIFPISRISIGENLQPSGSLLLLSINPHPDFFIGNMFSYKYIVYRTYYKDEYYYKLKKKQYHQLTDIIYLGYRINIFRIFYGFGYVYYPEYPGYYINTIRLEVSNKENNYHNKDLYYVNTGLINYDLSSRYFAKIDFLFNKKVLLKSSLNIGGYYKQSINYTHYFDIEERNFYAIFRHNDIYNYDYYLFLGYSYWYSASILSFRLNTMRHAYYGSIDMIGQRYGLKDDYPIIFPEINYTSGQKVYFSVSIGCILNNLNSKSKFGDHFILKLEVNINMNLINFEKTGFIRHLL